MGDIPGVSIRWVEPEHEIAFLVFIVLLVIAFFYFDDGRNY